MSVQGTCRLFDAQSARSYIENQPFYTNQKGFNPIEEKFTKLEPLPIDGYREIYKKWDGIPIFKQQDGKFVHLLNVTFPNNPKESFDAVIPVNWPHVQLLSKPSPESSASKAGIVAYSIFPNIKHYVGIALGLPLTIDGIEPPNPGVLAKLTCVKAFFPDAQSSDGLKFRYGDLIPLTLAECKKLPKWDGLPVFKDAEGNPVRPFVATFKNTKKLLILNSSVHADPILGITVTPFGSPPRNIPMVSKRDFSKFFEMIPLFDKPLAEEDPTLDLPLDQLSLEERKSSR